MEPLRSIEYITWLPQSRNIHSALDSTGLIDPRQCLSRCSCCCWWSPLGESERWRLWACSGASQLSSCWSAAPPHDSLSPHGCSQEKPCWWWARGPGPAVRNAWLPSPQEPCSCLWGQQEEKRKRERLLIKWQSSLLWRSRWFINKADRVWVSLNT